MKDTKIGTCTLVRKIAVGGMAEVYLALQEGFAGFEREVVVKCLHDRLSEDTEFNKMFQDEAKLVARLNHPNIVSVYEFGRRATPISW